MIECISDCKNCILISPKVTRCSVQLITDYKSLELYKNIDKNTHVHQEESDDLTNQFLEQVKGKTYTYKK